jgi:hypothetical protein
VTPIEQRAPGGLSLWDGETRSKRRRIGRVATGLVLAGTAYLAIGTPRASADPVLSSPTVSCELGCAPVSFALATDPVSGPLIAFHNRDGFVWAKEGSLDAGWVFEKGPGIEQVSVASDERNGPLVAVLDQSGTLWAKEGSLDAGWVFEESGIQAFSVASDARHGPLVGILDKTGTLWAKEGSLDAGWVFEKGTRDDLITPRHPDTT